MWPLFLLVSPAVLLPLASATNYDASGTFTLNTTSSSSGCLVLAQLTPPSTLQSLLPICPAGTPYASALGGTAVPWPLNANGSGTASDLLLFGAVGSDGGEEAPYFARPGCALDLGPEEVQYVLDRTLGFDAASGEVYDYSAEGYIMNGTSGGPLVCSTSSPYLAAGDWLPDPYSYAATDTVWSTPITVSLASSASSAGATSSSSSHSVAASASTSAVELVGGTSSATAPPTCAASTVTVSASAAVSTVTTTVSELATASRASVAAEALTVTVTVTATAAASATASGDECSAVTITEHVTVTAT
ncbi:hypothetical protein Q5752_000876 [Cryptotrichosporon argae]